MIVYNQKTELLDEKEARPKCIMGVYFQPHFQVDEHKAIIKK